MILALLFLLAATSLAVGITAIRETRANRAELARQVNGIHRAGSDSHRALARLEAWEAETTARFLPSTGKHTGEAA